MYTAVVEPLSLRVRVYASIMIDTRFGSIGFRCPLITIMVFYYYDY